MFCPQAPVWGDIATWVGGGATSLTLIFLVYQWWRQWRTEQARQVFAWIGRDGREPVEIRLGNSSGLPVYDVFVYRPLVQNFLDSGFRMRLFYRIMRWEMLEMAQIGARMRGNDSSGLLDIDCTPSAIRVLPPGMYRLDGVNFEAPGIPDPSLYFGVEIVFRDSRGVRWTRRASGKLKRSRVNPHWFQNNHAYGMRRAAMTGGSPFAAISRVRGESPNSDKRPEAGDAQPQ